jgi:hypothetical protein
MVEKRDDSDDEGEEKKPQRGLTPLEALESYSGSHSESINELLEWPARRFTKAFEYYQKRKTVDELENKKNLHVAAFWSNSSFDGKEETIKSIEDYYELLKDIVLKDPKETERENKELEQMEENDPFLRAGKRNLAKIVPQEIRYRQE